MNHSNNHLEPFVTSMNERKAPHVLAQRATIQKQKQQALLWFLASGTAVIAALSLVRLFW